MSTMKEKKLTLSQAIEESRETHMLRLELFNVVATETKAKFDAYLATGFTEPQAMQLCCAEIGRR